MWSHRVVPVDIADVRQHLLKLEEAGIITESKKSYSCCEENKRENTNV